MSDDFGEEPRRSRKRSQGSGNSTLKVLLIVFGGLAGLALISCCGVGGYLFYAGRKFVKQMAITTPAEVQQLTAEMTDIAIPPEFAPKQGMNMFGLKMVRYDWCPGGNCPGFVNGPETLTLTSMVIPQDGQPGQRISTFSEDEFTDEALKQTWNDFTKTEHEFDIRGKKCKFYVIQGEQVVFDSEFDADDDEAEPVAAAEGSGQPPAPFPARKAVQVSGAFPGKEGEVTLELNLAPENYDEEQILGMLRSIH